MIWTTHWERAGFDQCCCIKKMVFRHRVHILKAYDYLLIVMSRKKRCTNEKEVKAINGTEDKDVQVRYNLMNRWSATGLVQIIMLFELYWVILVLGSDYSWWQKTLPVASEDWNPEIKIKFLNEIMSVWRRWGVSWSELICSSKFPKACTQVRGK